MSRTYRRLNAPMKKAKRYLTEWEYLPGMTCCVRVPYKDEKKFAKAFYDFYGESSHNNRWSPGPWYREVRNVELRQIAKSEIHKFMRNPDHEVMIPEVPQSHLRDWY